MTYSVTFVTALVALEQEGKMLWVSAGGTRHRFRLF